MFPWVKVHFIRALCWKEVGLYSTHTWKIATQASPMLSNEMEPWNGLLPAALQRVKYRFQLTQVTAAVVSLSLGGGPDAGPGGRGS